MFEIIWFTILILFAIVEGVALIRTKPGDTFSEFLRGKTKKYRPYAIVAWVIFAVWFLFHIWF